MKSVSILDYGCGNILSLKNSLEYLGYKVNYLSENKKKLSNVYIIPGVGSFKKAMKLIREEKIDILINELIKKEVPIIGICLGMQLLFQRSNEFVKTNGLNLISGDVVKFRKKTSVKIPHVGWNKIKILDNNQNFFFNKFENKYFYFIH